MSRRLSFLLTFVASTLLVPSVSHAAVVISEVAWMGTSVSANAEWIELQNTDSVAVDLSGWTLVSSSGTPAITLSGLLAGSGFFLLERTSDASVPGITADQIYSGSLSNSGLTVTLKNSTGTVQDTVIGGTDWQSIGGDNTTKQTPQRTLDTWVTAVATPRAINAVTSSATSTTATSTPSTTTEIPTPQTSVGGNALTAPASVNPTPKLFVDAGPGKVVAVGAAVPFRAHVYDSTSSVRRDARITWSFGDGSYVEGPDLFHTFLTPGTYLVIVHASAGNAQVSSAITVRAEESHVRIVRADATGITVRNEQATILDLSDWKLWWGSNSFTFPFSTAILGGQEITFPVFVTGLSATTSEARLQFPDGKLATMLATTTVPEEPEEVSQTILTPILQPKAFFPGIPHIEARVPVRTESVTKTPDVYPQTLAPSAPVDAGVLGAQALPAWRVLKSPWTISFLGLLVAAGTVLVVI